MEKPKGSASSISSSQQQNQNEYLVVQQLKDDACARVPVMNSYERTFLRGHALAPVCAAALVHCALQALAYPAPSDMDYSTLQEYYLNGKETYHCASVVMRAAQLQVSGKVLESKLCRLAAAQVCHARIARHLLEAVVCAKADVLELVGYCEFQAYDETPLRAGLKDDFSKSMMAGIGSAGTTAPSSDMAAIQRLSSAWRQQSIICKVLQTHQGYGMVIHCGAAGYLKIIGEQACPLQILERTTTQAIACALQKQSNSSQHSEHFKFRIIAHTSDKGSSNQRAEKEALSQKPSQWTHLSLKCEIHDIAAYSQLLMMDSVDLMSQGSSTLDYLSNSLAP